MVTLACVELSGSDSSSYMASSQHPNLKLQSDMLAWLSLGQHMLIAIKVYVYSKPLQGALTTPYNNSLYS